MRRRYGYLGRHVLPSDFNINNPVSEPEDVKCLYCGAEPGQKCYGKDVMGRHLARWKLFDIVKDYQIRFGIKRQKMPSQE